MEFKAVVELAENHVLTGNPITFSDFPHDRAVSIPVHLSLVAASDSDSETPEIIPTPSVTPTEEPTVTPTETPGSDEPYRPILPPAGFVYNITGFIPLAAGFLLLFLLFAFRGNLVYRLLRKQAKKNGHKPEKETLKATAAGVAALIRNEETYPEWRSSSETTARLTADIIQVLDEMQYPAEIPRELVVAEIIKAAKGRINRHRL